MNEEEYEEKYNELLKENAQLKNSYEKLKSTSLVYTHISHALSRDYTDLFYVNMENGDYIEYYTDNNLGAFVERRRSTNFFKSCSIEGKLYVHPDDQEFFITSMTRDFLGEVLSKNDIYTMTYRRIKGNRTFYVQMKVSRMKDDNRFIVIAVSDIDELVKKRRAEERLREERIVYARLHAITGNYIIIHVVEPDTNYYHEFSSKSTFTDVFPLPKEGKSFFDEVREVAPKYTHPDDLERFLAVFTKENIMEEIKRCGIFTFGYRFFANGKVIHVQLKAAMVDEQDGTRLIIGLNDIDAQVRQEEKMEKRVEKAESQVIIDALTGVKNKLAYSNLESRINIEIENNCAPPFALVMLDINDLKIINDTSGHQAGDQYIREACRIICYTFKHSPVFRIGGDEFVVISQGSDYDNIDNLVQKMYDHNEEALKSNGVVVACGMSKYDADSSVADVFKRADNNMYEDKMRLKSTQNSA